MKIPALKLSKRTLQRRVPNLNLRQFNLSSEVLVLGIITSLLSLLLVQNIYTSLNDLGNYDILSQEREELEIIKSENDKLLKEKHYYESPYYVRLYAREALNLVEPGQDLFVIERKKEYNYEKTNDRMEKLDMNNYRKWWTKLLL